MNQVNKDYDKLLNEYNESVKKWNQTINKGVSLDLAYEPETFNEFDFVDEEIEKGAKLKDLLDWVLNRVDGDDGYILDLIRYINSK